MKPVLVDPAVFLHALGGPDPLKQPCRKVIADEDLELCASAELVQEVVFHRQRVGDDQAVTQAEKVARSCRLLALDQRVLELTLGLIERHGIGARAAMHAATALVHGIPEIVSPDPAFDGIEGLTRLDPREMG